MKIFKNEKLKKILVVDVKKKEGFLFNEYGIGVWYKIDIQYNTSNHISKIRLV